MNISTYYDKNNKNFFDIEKEFFIIDSEHLEDVQTRLYGFSVQGTGIFENENLTEAAVSGLDGCGVYVYIERQQEKIRIQQDFTGVYGIYIYRNADRFVLSNSFFRLIDYIKYWVPLSLDRDYANDSLLDTLDGNAYSVTSVNEIKLLDKSLAINIDINTKNLSFQIIEYDEGLYTLDSREGIDILDYWFQKWTTVFRNLQTHTNQITIDLSGGFDSRITFLLIIKSGLNLSEITINSTNNKLHTHEEDYEIASKIADYYGITLNNRKNIDEMALNYSLQDIINISFYTKMTFHKEMYFKYHKFLKKRFSIPGAGGESMRAFLNVSPQKFMEQMAGKSSRYSKALADEMEVSERKILQNAYNAIEEKHHIGEPESVKYPINIQREIRDRRHFGKAQVEAYFSNIYIIAPLLDPHLRKIDLCTPDCQDNNLLMAVIYMRYCPELLNFKFQGNRAIDEKTIQFAKKLSDKFPIVKNNSEVNETFSIIAEDRDLLKLISRGENNQEIPAGTPERYLKDVFDSSAFRKLFATYFDEELYVFASNWAKTHEFYPLRHCYSIIGLVRVIEDIILSQQLQAPSVIQSMDRVIGQNFYEPDDTDRLIDMVKNYLTARIDVSSSDFKLQYVSDTKARITMPAWFQKDGKGYVVESYGEALDLSFKINTAGKLDISLKGKDIRDIDGLRRIPYWINYNMLTYNGVTEFAETKYAWHDKPIKISHQVKAGEIVNLHIEWQPCKVENPGLPKLLETKLKGTEKKLNVSEKKLKASLAREASLKKSVSFRTGRAITWFPRKVRGGVRCLRDHGPAYTVKRFFWHITH